MGQLSNGTVAGSDAAQPGSHLAPFCVFLAEDDQEFRTFVAQTLRADGYRVLEASDGATLLFNLARISLERRPEPRPALIICDVRMPACGGLTVLRNMLEHGDSPPFAFITAFPDDWTREEAQRLGALRLFEKPFPIDELRRFVRQQASAGRA